MFYLHEFFLRLKYIFFSFLITCFCCYLYKDFLITMVSISLLKHSFFNFSTSFGKFIYTHPVELFKTQLLIIILLSFLVCLPYIVWNILEFLKSSFYSYEYKIFYFKFLQNFSLFLIINYFAYFFLFPNLWHFFESFNTFQSNLLNFSFELKIQEFLSFILDFIYFVNFFLLIFFILSFIISKFGISNLIYWKKLFIFLNIMFATFLSPPDVYSQLIILFLLSFCLEVFILITLYFLKLKKKILIRHHIK